MKLHELRTGKRIETRSMRNKHNRACGRKQSFFSKRDAEEWITKKGDRDIEAYHCAFCFDWHVGHTPRFYRDLKANSRERAKQDRRNYLNHIKRLQEENRLLASALADERRFRQHILAEYHKRIRSRFLWILDLIFMSKGD